MHTITKTLTAALALGTALIGTGAANAQEWGSYRTAYGQAYGQNYNQNYRGGNYRDPREQDAINRELVQSTCSGQRANALEIRLRDERRNGRLNDWDARKIQNAIDQVQYRERRECSEHDFRAARDIGKEYVRIRAWMDQESGRYRGGYRGHRR